MHSIINLKSKSLEFDNDGRWRLEGDDEGYSKWFNENTGRLSNKPSDVTSFIDGFKNDYFHDRKHHHYRLEPFPPFVSFNERGKYYHIETA